MANPFFALNFRPNVALVSVVRRFVVEFFTQFLDDPDSTSRIALATHELLENGVKYASDEETNLSIEIRSDDTGRTVVIQTRNRAGTGNIAKLRELVDEMNQQDAMTFYQTLMRRSLGTPLGCSGLGIARIRTEGEMSVELNIDNDTVTIVATARA